MYVYIISTAEPYNILKVVTKKLLKKMLTLSFVFSIF